MKHEMRVGICHCAPQLVQYLGGEEVSLEGSIYTIKALVTQPGYRYRKELIQKRCQFFLDHHVYRQRRFTTHLLELQLAEIISNGQGRGWKLYLGGAIRYELHETWEGSALPAAEVITQKMSELIHRLPEKRLKNFMLRLAEGQNGQTAG